MFVPAVSTTASRGLVFALQGQSLCVVSGELPQLPTDNASADLYLGTIDGIACFARDLGEHDVPPPGCEPVSLRHLFGALPQHAFEAALYALGLTAWDRDHRHCGRCGGITERSTRERVRTCTQCGFGAYPRISPAIIVLVERDGKALLARNARTQLPFYSTLAGFVEVGESLEQCVAREVREEASIELTAIQYFGSQPWPFSNSVMLGFTARWASGDIVEAPDELLDARWFAPDELPTIPPKLSIARQLIDDFVRRHTAG